MIWIVLWYPIYDKQTVNWILLFVENTITDFYQFKFYSIRTNIEQSVHTNAVWLKFMKMVKYKK